MAIEYCPQCGSNDLVPLLGGDLFSCPGCVRTFALIDVTERGWPARSGDDYSPGELQRTAKTLSLFVNHQSDKGVSL